MKWTKEEEQFLTDNYSNGPTYCAKKLSRSYQSVQLKALKLNLTKTKAGWSNQEEQFLTDNYAEHGPKYCAEKLNRTYNAVTLKANRLNLQAPNYNKQYLEEEEQFLIENYAEHGPAYCAEKLNRTYQAMTMQAIKLNLQANTKYNSNIVYLVYFPDFFLYKVGITNNIERRIKRFGQPCVILKTQECEPKEAIEIERKLLKSVTLINTGALNNGNTETFMQPSKEIELFLK